MIQTLNIKPPQFVRFDGTAEGFAEVRRLVPEFQCSIKSVSYFVNGEEKKIVEYFVNNQEIAKGSCVIRFQDLVAHNPDALATQRSAGSLGLVRVKDTMLIVDGIPTHLEFPQTEDAS